MQETSDIVVFLAQPDYDGKVCKQTSRAVWMRGDEQADAVMYSDGSGSLLAHTFNLLWAPALTAYEMGKCSHFCMLHSDVVPEVGWLDIMLGEMKAQQCQVLSAVVAIKDGSGDTSTALTIPGNEWDYSRLSLSDLEKLPETFSADDIPQSMGNGGSDGLRELLVNTGLMLVDLRGGWATQTNEHGELLNYFTIKDRVVKQPDGRYQVTCLPEDWGFSKMAARAGVKVMATTKVAVGHIGTAVYRNTVRRPHLAEANGHQLAAACG